MALALKTPITDATPQKLVASLERVILSIVTEVAAPCKHAMLVQVITGKDFRNTNRVTWCELCKNRANYANGF